MQIKAFAENKDDGWYASMELDWTDFTIAMDRWVGKIHLFKDIGGGVKDCVRWDCCFCPKGAVAGWKELLVKYRMTETHYKETGSTEKERERFHETMKQYAAASATNRDNS